MVQYALQIRNSMTAIAKEFMQKCATYRCILEIRKASYVYFFHARMNCLGFMKMRFATDKYMFPYFLEVLDLASRQGGRDRELAVEHVTEKKRPVIAGLDLHPRLYTKEPSRCKRADQYSILLLVFKQYCSPNMNYVANNVLPPKHANNAI